MELVVSLNSLSLGVAAASRLLPNRLSPSARGEWMFVRALPLGREAHPLSVTTAVAEDELSVVVSARSGDWSLALATLARSSQSPAACQLEVEIAGPFPAGEQSARPAQACQPTLARSTDKT